MLRPLLAVAIGVAALGVPAAHAAERCVGTSFGGACVESFLLGGTGPTLRVRCGGTMWNCMTIVIP